MPSSHAVWCLCYPDFQPLDLTGPHEVFAAANEVARRTHYELRVIAPITEPGPVRAESGLGIWAEPLPDPTTINGGTLLIVGGNGARGTALDDEILVDWIRAAADSADRTATVCTGAFLAGAAGLLDGKRVTTHWARSANLAARHPTAAMEPDSIWVHDGPLWSSAGVTAGIDLALALVEHDHGAAIAQEVARWLVVFLRRPGGQSQFAAPVWTKPAETSTVRVAQDLIHADPAADLSTDRLAAAAGLSTRHLVRRFQAEIGHTPARYVEKVRVEAARGQLETATHSIAAVARHCGFGTAETMRRSFRRHLGVSPDQYRRRFAAAVTNPPPTTNEDTP